MLIDLRTDPGWMDAVLALNARFETETSPLSADQLQGLLDQSVHAPAWVIGPPAESPAKPPIDASAAPPTQRPGAPGGTAILGGFLIALGPDASYDSPNYRWFQARGGRFAYVDRVIVAPEAGRGGIARALYADLARAALAAGLAEITCEVNRIPPNPASDAFHARLGFAEIGRMQTGAKTVRFLSLPAAAGAAGGAAAGTEGSSAAPQTLA
ncbi:MAG: GNAT family N-acetyltransferase [Pseudomonadota bacterium]